MNFKIIILISIGVVANSLDDAGFQLAQSDDCGKIDEVQNDLRTKAPWSAGIFARTSVNKPFQFYITGTIIGPTTVITVLGGAYGQPPADDRKYAIPEAANHIVATGLLSTNLSNTDEHYQFSEVSYILPYGGKAPGNSEYHYFIFHLKKPLNFSTPYVRPACVPIFLKTFPLGLVAGKTEVRHSGFTASALTSRKGSSTRYLQVTEAKLDPQGSCNEKYEQFYDEAAADHVYCGTSVVTTNPPTCVSYGSALVVPVYNDKWFIVGILALHPTPLDEVSWCSGRTVYFYGKIINVLNWILDNLKCSSSEFACGDGLCISAERVCDRSHDCPDGRDEDPIYCRARKPCIAPGKKFECGTYGPCLRDSLTCDGRKDCPDGEDENLTLCGGSHHVADLNPPLIKVPTLIKRPLMALQESNRMEQTSLSPTHIYNRNGLFCPPLQQSEGVTIKCFDSNKESIPCDQAVPGTTVRLQCQLHYSSTYRLPTTEMTCKENGAWKPFRSFGCKAECGILENKSVQSLIVSGQAATPQQSFPWHVAMFVLKNNDSSFICGGSLIEKSVVITAAHCVTDGSGSLVSKSTLKLVIGGNSSTFTQNNHDAQIFGIKNIWVPATYDRRTLQSDIALIQLDSDAIYGRSVRPVCYLIKGSSRSPPAGTLGKVPGYGYTSEHKISENLIFAQFPVISTSECVSSLKKTPPLSTFCAGYKNGTSVCQGDSGGGMVFPETSGSVEKYVIKGLVSHGEVKIGRLCDPNNYAVFTHVDAYADWILQKLDSVLRR